MPTLKTTSFAKATKRVEQALTQQSGFDHGKTNPTVIERRYFDCRRAVLFLQRILHAGREFWENASVI